MRGAPDFRLDRFDCSKLTLVDATQQSKSARLRRKKPAMASLTRFLALLVLIPAAIATPTVSFPFNSQVPTVARVGQEYSYTISSSTFTHDSSASNLTYSLSNQPAWLTINSATATLSGIPGTADAGTSNFLLTAADNTGAASLDCTLIISSDPAPQIMGNIAEQLAQDANLSSTAPTPVVTLLPKTDFRFDFQQSSFIDIVQRKLFYYATLQDHTPLPSWLSFDASDLSFSGVAPELSAFPQSWNIVLIASDVKGFAGTSAGFTIAIGTEQLAFVPEIVNISVPDAGQKVDFTELGVQLWRNGEQVQPDQLESAKASGLPGWLSFDEKSLDISGAVPSGNDDVGGNFTVTVNDSEGNQASVVLNLVSKNASSTTAVAGGLTTSTASSGASSQSSATSTSTSSGGSSTSAPPSIGLESNRSDPKRLDGGIIAAIVILSILGAVFILVALIWCLRRRRRDRGYVSKSPTPSKNTISRPIAPPGPSETITVTTELQRDVEKGADAEQDTEGGATEGPEVPPKERAVDPPPQIQLNLPLASASAANNRMSRWSKRFSRMSQTSSIGVGGEAMLRNSNIPELGQGADSLHTPHDSFSVPTEMARGSRNLSQTSPTKRVLARLQENRRSRDRDSVGLGISSVIGGGVARHSSKRGGRHRRGRSSYGGLSTTRERSSMASISTRGTSVLSAKASEFPMPPISMHSNSASGPSVSIYQADPKRKSIRLVERSDSIVDNRPLQDKRESFIRARASQNWSQSPLFAHGSRAESKQTVGSSSRSGNGSLPGSVRRSRRSKNGKSMNTLATYSESSSLEPQVLKSPRKSKTRESKRLSARIRSVFPENFPRVISRTTLDEDAEVGLERDESSNSWDTIGSDDWVRDLSKPRNERSWVLPDEASPTPPPASLTEKRRSQSRNSKPSVQDWRRKLREKSSSPLSSVQLAAAQKAGPSGVQTSQTKKNRLSEPMGLVSVDSLSKTRPGVSQTNSQRPVSVEEVQRLSSMKAEQDAATMAGSERWDDGDSEDELKGAGLMSRPPSAGKMQGTQTSARSDLSGPAFL